MARVTEYGNAGNGRSNQDNQDSQNNNIEVIAAGQDGPLQVPNADFIRDADITREGQDLVLETPDGAVVVIEGYFNADPAPMITAPDGSALTPKLVNNFVQENGPLEYARADSVIDQSAVGEVLEITGQANVVRADGSTEPLTIGTPIYQGDIIETEAEGAVNIQFVDESTFAVSENARLAIDEYVFDPSTESGSTNFSVLRGIFVFTSGLIGRDDPDDVQIDTPVGSIGIRGTTIMGNVDTGEITVVEGAIVLRSYSGKEMTLDEQFETGKFDASTGDIIDMGKMSSDDISSGYESISGVMPSLFSSFDDSGESADDPVTDETQTADADASTEQQSAAEGNESTTEQTGDDDTQQTSTETTDEAATETDETTETAGETTETAETTAETQQTATLEGDDINFDVATDTTLDGTSSDTQTNNTTSGSTSSGTTSTTTTTSDSTTVLPLDLEINRLAVDDNLADGQIIAAVRTTSDFPGVEYKLNNDLGGTIGLFKGSNGEAVIKLVSGPLTTGDTLDISITATVPDGRSITEQYGVNVVDVNDAPIIANGGSAFAIDEDASFGEAVGSVTASDPNGDTLSYSIVSGNTSNAFSIDAAGNISVNNALDYETQTSYTLSVRVTDDGFGTLSDMQTFTININDINETPVINNPASTASIAENAAGGTQVYDASTFASDLDGDALTYTITGGNTGGAFNIDANTGKITLNGGVIDYETLTNYSLTVEASDGALTDTATFNININDVDDEAATITTNGGQTTNEGTPVTITNADLKATDLDTTTSGITYTVMTPPTNGQIELTTSPGVAVASFTQADIDAGQVIYVHDGSKTASTDSFEFSVSDSVNGSEPGTFNFTINDVSAPVLVESGTHESGLSGLTARDTELQLRFDEDIQLGTGNITIKKTSNDSLVDQIAIGGAFVKGGNNLTVELNNLLDANTDYYVEIDNGAITDLNGNAYSGITNKTEFTFTTGRATFMTTVGGLGADEAKAALEVSEGYIVIGDSVRGGNHDITITKYDHHGFVQDVTMIGGSSNEFGEGVAQNGVGIFIGGTTNGAASAGSQDFMLSSLDADGNLNWTHVYGTGANESLSAITSVGSTNIAMAGTVHTADSSGLVTMVNGTGSIVWETNLSETGIDITTTDVLGLTDGKYGSDLLVGGTRTDSNNNDNMMISRINEMDGSLLWSYNVQTIDVTDVPNELNAMTELTVGGNAGNIVLAGSTLLGTFDDQGLLVYMNTDGSGNNPAIDWAVTIGDAGSGESIADVIELSNGNLAVVGNINNSGFVAEIDVAEAALGNPPIAWARSLEHGTDQVSFSSIEQADDGSLIISGVTTNAITGKDAFTLSMTSAGSIENDAGTLTMSGILGNGWEIFNQDTITTETLTVGTDIMLGSPGITANTFDNATTNLTNTDWVISADEDSSDVDHAVDALGTTSDYVGTSSVDNENLTGQNGVFSGFTGDDEFTVDGFDVVNMGSGNDKIIFAGSNDGATIYPDELGYIDGGSGADTFSLSTNNDLDLSALQANDDIGLSNIEILDLNSSSDVTVKLTYDAVIGMTDSNNTLIIDGTASDSVEANLDLSGNGFSPVDSSGGTQGAGYEYYTDGTVHLYIQDAVDQANIA